MPTKASHAENSILESKETTEAVLTVPKDQQEPSRSLDLALFIMPAAWQAGSAAAMRT